MSKLRFSGLHFRPRRSKNRSGNMIHFNFRPGRSDKAVNAIRAGDSSAWNLHLRSDKSDRRSVADVQPDIRRLAPVLRAVLRSGATIADARNWIDHWPDGKKIRSRSILRRATLGSRRIRDADPNCGEWQMGVGGSMAERMKLRVQYGSRRNWGETPRAYSPQI